jgi:hypothetical protein
MNNKNELHVSKLITEMPKLNMSHNARLVLYSVLKKVWQTFRNREDYISKDILTEEDYKIAQRPISLNLSDLKPLFKKNATYKDIKEHIQKVPYEAMFKTNIDSFGVKRNYLLDVKIALFKKVEFDDKNKTITFEPAEYMLDYIEALKSFARIDIKEMKELTSSNYAMRAYEFICQNNYLDKNNKKLVSDEVRKVKIDDFRRYFEVPDTYLLSNIDQKVFKPIKRLINKHTKYDIVEIKKFKLNSSDKKKVSHIRIDVKYKEEYLKELKELKEKSIQKISSSKDEINNYSEIETTPQEMFNKIWNLYPLKKGKAEVTIDDMIKLKKLGYETIKICIDRYLKYIEEKKKEGFNQSLQNGYKFFTTGYIDYLDENYIPYEAKYINNSNNKPIQSTNFEQREYDDDFFESLYDNFKK